MQASNFGGTFDQLFLRIFFYKIFTEDASQPLLYRGAKKVNNDQKLKSRWVLPYEAGHTEAKSRDSASDDARFHSNLRIRRCKIAKNRSMSHRPASCDFHRLILHQAILVLLLKECVPATHGSAKFVHRCLALRTPVLPARCVVSTNPTG